MTRTSLRTMLLALVAFLCVASVSMAQPAEKPDGTAARANTKSPLAINLAGVVDWSTEMVFVDIFKHSRKWISQAEGKPWGKGPKLSLTGDGWIKELKPGQFATTIMLTHRGHPAGRYVCLYDGEGELEFTGNAKVTSNKPGRIELDIAAKGGLFLNLRKTNPANPVRNIRVLMPGFEKSYAKQVYYPPFLKRTGHFRSIRFMDWMKTNGSTIVHWNARPKLTDARQSINGVALEHMIDICNRLKCDPWFCMPHLADDEFIRQFAKQVEEQLDPSLKVYIEYSNEVWNGQFAQARYAQKQGLALKLSDNNFQAQLYFYSKRSVENFAIWEKVFGSTDRLVRVMAAQSSNPWTSEQVLNFQKAFKQTDALAIAPYFGHELGSPKTADEVAAMEFEEVFAICRKAIAKNHETIKKHVALAKSFSETLNGGLQRADRVDKQKGAGTGSKKQGLRVIAYEGGQHLAGHGGSENNQALVATLIAANRHPEMNKLYLEDMASWKAAGGELFAVFSSVSTPSKWGSWGILEAENQPPSTALKYQAVLQFMRENPVWWKE